MSWSEIWAYAQATQGIEDAWEARALRLMSKAFVEGRYAGETPLSRAPIDRDAYYYEDD